MTPLYKFFLALTLNLVLSVPLYAAQSLKHKNINFPIKAEALLKGEVHYFFAILSPRQLAVQYGELFNLDSLSLNQESNVQMVINKAVYIVNKPVGFFDDKQMMEEKFVSHMFKGQLVSPLGTNAFKVSIPGKDGYSYRMQSYFDADDISTLPNSKVITAVSAARKLDVISQSASTVMFTEKTNFSKYTEGGVSVSSFIPMKENKTMIITYNIWGVKKPVSEKELLNSFLEEVGSSRKLLESFKQQ